ncbi:helix-turn-helix domain-containing protein [Pedobacter sp. N36a]|uniref:helix-turn-helix domain-containing protein n=1 Tax=Pedobacter sp. N36a TaxID=2767996 RepID=UPI00165754D2|nr:helix-turn-helix transcriptional regulator [Pedobacter sp. N36a]MBC8988167.1 helix-turn-helix domain-containing protein [Pedobacter sp. N36a]
MKRIEKGFSQQYMAIQLNISQNVYSINERNIKAVRLERLVKICYILDISPFNIFDEIANINQLP